jgi:hypothetical protein
MPKSKILDVLKIAPLALIANIAAAIQAIGIDVPIIDVKQEGDDLLIILYGGRIESFPLDYNLMIKIDNLADNNDEPLALAATVLGRDKNSLPDWKPEIN